MHPTHRLGPASSGSAAREDAATIPNGDATARDAALRSDAKTASSDAGAPRPDGGGIAHFIHPGLLNSADIARMKAKIASKSNPWFNDYNTLANNNLSSATRGYNTPPPIIGRNSGSAYASVRGNCELDATAAYQNAVLYVLTGQNAHADYAVKVLNAYAAGVKHFDGVDPERDLEGAILGWLWVQAAAVDSRLPRLVGHRHQHVQQVDLQCGLFRHRLQRVWRAHHAHPERRGRPRSLCSGTKLAIGIDRTWRTI